jgi:hypothetical protein
VDRHYVVEAASAVAFCAPKQDDVNADGLADLTLAFAPGGIGERAAIHLGSILAPIEQLVVLVQRLEKVLQSFLGGCVCCGVL